MEIRAWNHRKDNKAAAIVIEFEFAIEFEFESLAAIVIEFDFEFLYGPNSIENSIEFKKFEFRSSST